MKRSEKHQKLIDYFTELGSVAIAFSGGVDSTFVLAVAHEALGDKAIALTLDASYIPRAEIEDSKKIAALLSVRHILLNIDIPESISTNPRNRCYLCKHTIFSRLMDIAEDNNIAYVVDGSNEDDRHEDRPGLAALTELGVKSPLLELGISKADVRAMSKKMDLPTWNKPSYACLLTRLPFDQAISPLDLSRIEKAEKFMTDIGFPAVRVRLHGDLARIEVEKIRRAELFGLEIAKRIAKKFTELGFAYTAVDLEGYRVGGIEPAPRPKTKD